METLSNWLKEIRAPFLLLPLVLVFLGTSIAATDVPVHYTHAIWAAVGLMLLHIAVNVFNEYSDFHTGIDFDTDNTPFSGGSGMLVESKIAPNAALAVGIFCLTFAIFIGIYCIWVSNWGLLPLLVVGIISVCLYTDVLAKNTLGEIFAGLGLGFLPVLGAYFVQTGSYSLEAAIVAIPSGLLTFNLLLINEFPDYEADVKGGRKNILITFGIKTGGRVYVVAMGLVYGIILMAALTGIIPKTCLIALGTLPIALRPIMWTWDGAQDKDVTLDALGANVTTNLVTQTLLGIGFLLSLYVDRFPSLGF